MSTIIGYFSDSKLYGNDSLTSDPSVRRTASSTSTTFHFARVKLQALEQQVGFSNVSLNLLTLVYDLQFKFNKFYSL